jgi:hypothetical protein
MAHRKSLITGLIGFAMLATPIAASATINDGRIDYNNAAMSRSYDTPASDFPVGIVVPATMTGPEFRDQHGTDTWNSAPIVLVDDWREDRYERNHRWGNDGWRYRRGYNYNRGYYGYAMPRGYSGGSCGWARHLRQVYNQDRYSGHPAAASDLLPQMRRAERSCGGANYGYNRWHRYY